MRVSLRNAIHAQERLEDICRDDVIAEDEETPLSHHQLLAGAGSSLHGNGNFRHKKIALAGTKADSTRKTF